MGIESDLPREDRALLQAEGAALRDAGIEASDQNRHAQAMVFLDQASGAEDQAALAAEFEES